MGTLARAGILIDILIGQDCHFLGYFCREHGGFGGNLRPIISEFSYVVPKINCLGLLIDSALVFKRIVASN